MAGLRAIWHLGLKELVSLRHDKVLVVLIVYTFTIAVILPARNTSLDLRNAAVGIVDEDRSALSQRVSDSLLPPFFKRPVELSPADIDAALDSGRVTFVLDIPPHFQADTIAGRKPVAQLNIDSTAMSQAGLGATYISRIFDRETTSFVSSRAPPVEPVVAQRIRILFNPNLESGWFTGAMELVKVITILGVVLVGAAVVREAERGTIEHLLVMPLTPFEIMAAKCWANGLVIIVAAFASLLLVVGGVLGLPLSSTVWLFGLALVLYLFSVAAIGIFLATVVRSMPQLGLLFIPTVIPMILLSGSFTPIDSIPEAVQWIMAFSPTRHFVEATTSTLFRNAGLVTVWPSLTAMALIGAAFFAGALYRFRRALTERESG